LETSFATVRSASLAPIGDLSRVLSRSKTTASISRAGIATALLVVGLRPSVGEPFPTETVME